MLAAHVTCPNAPSASSLPLRICSNTTQVLQSALFQLEQIRKVHDDLTTPECRDVLSFPVAVQRLKAAAEGAKIALSSQTSTRVVIPDLLPGKRPPNDQCDRSLSSE